MSDQDTFSKKLTDILNYGSLNLAMGLGYRARLFDVMDTLDTPATGFHHFEKGGVERTLCAGVAWHDVGTGEGR